MHIFAALTTFYYRLVCPSISVSAFIGPGFRDVMPIKETEDRVALFFRVLQWAADIACTSVFLETVRDRDNNVMGYRAWIPMDSIAVNGFWRRATLLRARAHV